MSLANSTGGGDAQRGVNTSSDGETGSIATVSIWSEKIAGKGEDGPPLILLSDDHSFGVIAVSDGLGGAGSRQVYFGDELASGAKVAATKLLDVILTFFKGTWLQEPNNTNTADALGNSMDDRSAAKARRHSEKRRADGPAPSASHEQMAGPSLTKVSGEARKTSLAQAGKRQPTTQLNPYQLARVGRCSAYLLSGAVCGPSVTQHMELLGKTIDDAFEKINSDLAETQSPSRLRTKIQRNLPSTLAGWVYRTAPEKEITAFWAGDSRCYILGDAGLRQISRDDAKGDFDAFAAIWADPPLTNYISERIPNSIRRRRLICDYPALLISASDGAFNYLPTPMDFEFVVLSSLMSSESMQSWADKLSTRLQAAAGDDVSMVLHPLGFDNFDNLKAFYRKRFDKLKGQFIEPLQTLRHKQAQLEKELASLRATAKEKTKGAWDQYRVAYEQYLYEGDLE